VKADEGKGITRGFSKGRKSSVLAGKPEPQGKRSEGRKGWRVVVVNVRKVRKFKEAGGKGQNKKTGVEEQQTPDENKPT